MSAMSRAAVKDVTLTTEEVILVKTLLVEHMLKTKQRIERLEHLGYTEFVKTVRKDFDVARELMDVFSTPEVI